MPRLELADREDLLLDENSAIKRVNFAVKCSFISGLVNGEKNLDKHLHARSEESKDCKQMTHDETNEK